MTKRYVPVVLRVDEAGFYEPRMVEFNGDQYWIERVVDVSRTVCCAVGGIGVRYTCVIRGRPAELWEEHGCWFVVTRQ